MKRIVTIGLLLSALVLAALFYFGGGGQPPSGQPALLSLTPRNVIEIKDEFNAAKGDVRLLLLLSPT
jgi:hypothetical protein